MDILGKDTLTLLRDRKIRETIDELLRRGEGCATVIVDNDAESGETKQIIVRRLVA
jgi:hypothetical protein